jgi:hypothetical protein
MSQGFSFAPQSSGFSGFSFAPQSSGFGAPDTGRAGGISFGTSQPNIGFSFGIPPSPVQAPSEIQTTVTHPKAWISILAHSSYHALNLMTMNRKLDTILIASVGNRSKMQIPSAATAFNEIAYRNDLNTTPSEILRQLNAVLKIQLSPEEESVGYEISPEKLAVYLGWMRDPGMISANRDAYYEKWFDFHYGMYIDGFVKLSIELDGTKQLIDIPIAQIPGYPKPTKTQILQYILSLYPALQEIIFVDLSCARVESSMTPQDFTTGILGGKKIVKTRSRKNRYRSRRIKR